MNAVLLSVPLIVFALVVLFGFAGCSLDKRGIPSGDDTDTTDNTGTPTSYEDAVKNYSKPIAYWRLIDPPDSEFAKDEIGPAPWGVHPGTYVGTVTRGVLPGLLASEIDTPPTRFDGGGYIEVANAAEFAVSEFTVEALVHPDSVSVDSYIVRNSSSSGGWALRVVGSSGAEPGIDGYFEARVWQGGGSAGTPQAPFDLAALGTAWHVAMTFDGTLLTLYIDGAEIGSAALPYAPNTTDPLQIGVDFHGALQEVAVYDKVLTPQQIGNHYIWNTSPGDGS